MSNCYRGMAIAKVTIGSYAITINGMISDERLTKLSRKEKRRLEAWRVEGEAFARWALRATKELEEMERVTKDQLEEASGILHDVQTGVSTVLRNAEEFVESQSGSDFEDRLRGLPEPARNLVNAVEVLQGRMNLIPLLVNPAAAGYGQRHPVPVYRAIDRLLRILRPVAEKQRLSIILKGTSFNRPLAYDSFEAVPLILLDNAIKYSRGGQNIEVEINDVLGGVRVEVASFSPWIPLDERTKIFERGFRGRHASELASRGSGLGLHLAVVVGKANGFEIRLSIDEKTVPVDGIPYCNVAFSFTLR